MASKKEFFDGLYNADDTAHDTAHDTADEPNEVISMNNKYLEKHQFQHESSDNLNHGSQDPEHQVRAPSVTESRPKTSSEIEVAKKSSSAIRPQLLRRSKGSDPTSRASMPALKRSSTDGQAPKKKQKMKDSLTLVPESRRIFAGQEFCL